MAHTRRAVTTASDAKLERLFTELREAQRVCDAARDISDEDLEVLADRVWDIEQRLFKTPARTPRGLLIKLQAWRYLYPDNWGDGDPAGAMVGAAIWRDAHRLAGEPVRRPT